MPDSSLSQCSAGLYVHIPFCSSKCAYCDFISYTGLEARWQPYIQGVCRELELRLPVWEKAIFDTLYIGGGTPTVLPAECLAGLIRHLLAHIKHTGGMEVTVEANPGTVTESYLAELRQAGANRLSIGVQSWQPDELAVLGRTHSREQALQAFQAARAADFTNINLDLMYGLPGQTLASWRNTLLTTLELRPEHLALYALTLDPATPMAQRVKAGTLMLPDDDSYADMYELAITICHQSGYQHYELSNWALPSDTELSNQELPLFASRHNVHYWRNERYLGLGAAAYSYDGVRRWGNTPQISEYLLNLDTELLAEAESESLSLKSAMGETAMLNLRMLRGLVWDEFHQRFLVDARDIYQNEIATLHDQGLLEVDDVGMRLSQRALFIANRVLSEFV
jgi:oxygen-independent coproporphyrinogen-3 oxidase